MTEEGMRRPTADEYAPSYAEYVERVPENDIVMALESQIEIVRAAFASFAPTRETYRYAPGKWSVRDLANHLADGERVFAYRALRFARADMTPLAGFEENDYVEHAESDSRRLADIVDELLFQRRANVLMFRAFAPAAWSRRGVASDNPVTVRALAYCLVGHTRHHLEVLQTRYA